jgi:hypothetical protein
MIEGILISLGVTLPIAILMYDMIIVKKRTDNLEKELRDVKSRVHKVFMDVHEPKTPSKGDEAYNILRTNAKRIGLSHCFK